MNIQFEKMSGAGNDFVVLDNRSNTLGNASQLAKKLCDRRFGIGADGLLLVENSNSADFKMRYLNADGSEDGMCGNGGRCIAKYAYDHHIVHEDAFTFEALTFQYKAQRLDRDIYELSMKDPVDIIWEHDVEIDSNRYKSYFIDTGSPHCVLFCESNRSIDDLNTIPVNILGEKIRHHKKYAPKGTNVNFVRKLSPTVIEIRTYERGVEEETLACGTGSIASAIIAAELFSMGQEIAVRVKSGYELQVSYNKTNDGITNVKLKGNASTIYTGNIEI